jgi:hypothetical protein
MEKNPQAALFPFGVMLALSKGGTKDIFGATKRVKMIGFWSHLVKNSIVDFVLALYRSVRWILDACLMKMATNCQ